MAKKKTAAPHVRFYAYTREPSVAPIVPKEKHDTDPWVYHGANNMFPEEIRALVDNCGPLERCVSMIAEFVAGSGLRFYDEAGNEIKEAQARFQEWVSESTEEEFLMKTAYDLAHGLGLTWSVRRAAGPIVRLDHMDRFGFRAGKTVTGQIPSMWWSADWYMAKTYVGDARFTPVEFPTFDFTGKRVDAQAIIFDRQYRPREPVYGRVYWLGCKRAAEVWTKVDRYNQTQIDTGFAPGVMLGTRFEGTDAELDKHDKAIEAAYTGSMGRGLLHFTMMPGEEEPFVQVLERGNHAGELDGMRNGAAEVIYETFGIPSLLLRERTGGLTSQEKAVAMRLQQLQRTTVATLQKHITRNLTRLMNMEGIPVWEARITPLELFDPIQSEAIIMASQTVNEAREIRGDEALEGDAGEMLLVQAKVPQTLQPEDPTAEGMEPEDDTEDPEEDNPIPG